jgi:multidrug transporter EmrE-like cation transporter
MSPKSALLLLLSASTAATSTAILRVALRDSYSFKGSVILFCQDSLRLLGRPVFLLGLVTFVAANMLWLLVLSSQKLSVAYPVQIGLVVLLNALISSVFFSERLTVQGYLGLVLIVLGVALIVR